MELKINIPDDNIEVVKQAFMDIYNFKEELNIKQFIEGKILDYMRMIVKAHKRKNIQNEF